jgi:hypothetical protein
MHPMIWRRAFSVAAASLLVLLAAGCASLGKSAAEKAVRERAQARWSALVEKDWKTAYSYLTPAYRAVVPLKRYGNQFNGPVQWESAEVRSVACEEKRCTAKVEITFRALIPGHMDRLTSTFIEEAWVLEEDGQWYKFETV